MNNNLIDQIPLSSLYNIKHSNDSRLKKQFGIDDASKETQTKRAVPHIKCRPGYEWDGNDCVLMDIGFDPYDPGAMSAFAIYCPFCGRQKPAFEDVQGGCPAGCTQDGDDPVCDCPDGTYCCMPCTEETCCAGQPCVEGIISYPQ